MDSDFKVHKNKTTIVHTPALALKNDPRGIQNSATAAPLPQPLLISILADIFGGDNQGGGTPLR